MKIMIMEMVHKESTEVLFCEGVLETAVDLWIAKHKQDDSVSFICAGTFEIMKDWEYMMGNGRIMWAWTGKGRWRGREQFRVHNF